MFAGIVIGVIGFILGALIAYLLGVRSKAGLLIAGVLGAVFAPILIVLITLVIFIVLITIILFIVFLLVIVFKIIPLPIRGAWHALFLTGSLEKVLFCGLTYC
ncbi:hypothetical protein J4526_03870 [Desulfurococcaceae archaeon MEX13E-LK6-19]|nr:hypothetical protein J4526_03870 [Desulfurococcaceae archaeon MEX13E-LK6-19]